MSVVGNGDKKIKKEGVAREREDWQVSMELDHIIARNLMQERMHPTLNGIEVQTALTWRSRNCDLENWVTFALNRLDRLRQEIEASVEHQILSSNNGCDVYCLDWIDVYRGMVDQPEREIVASVPHWYMLCQWNYWRINQTTSMRFYVEKCKKIFMVFHDEWIMHV